MPTSHNPPILLYLLLISPITLTPTLPTRTLRLSTHQPRRLHPQPRKLFGAVLGAVGGAALGGMAGSALSGPSADQKRKLERLRSDLDREKQQKMLLMMNRRGLIQEITHLVDKAEERLQELASMTTGKIYMLNSMIEAANMKQVKSVKKYLKASTR